MTRAAAQAIGRYTLHSELAHGGMATVHLGTLRGAGGFTRMVAIKRLHPHFAKDPEVVAMLLDEAHLAARIRHENVVSTLDVIAEGDELLLVMEYVAGESLARVLKRGQRVPLPIAAAIATGVLRGLHAAHEARAENGAPLEVVHRDVSPHNIMISVEGAARLVDFGVAKAAFRLQTTREGQLKGKLAYMAPEQFRNEPVTRTVDLRATAIVLWECLAGERMMTGANDAAVVERVLYGAYTPLGELLDEPPSVLDPILERALASQPSKRFTTAIEMAEAIEAATAIASSAEVSAWLRRVANDTLHARAELVATLERETLGAPVRSTSRSKWPIAVVLVALAAVSMFALRRHNPPQMPAPVASPVESATAAPPPPIASAPPIESSAPKKVVVAPHKKKAPAAPSTAKGKSLLPSGLPDDRN